jgi:hypothetical protein
MTTVAMLYCLGAVVTWLRYQIEQYRARASADSALVTSESDVLVTWLAVTLFWPLAWVAVLVVALADWRRR